jgi:hypothetical protein
MAKKGTFKPGQSGNPKGRPPLTPEEKAVRKITNEALEEIADLILSNDKPSLLTIAASQTDPAIRVIYAKAAVNAMSKGDVPTLELILNRLVGKAPDKVHLSGNNGGPIQTEHTPIKERIELLEKK